MFATDRTSLKLDDVCQVMQIGFQNIDAIVEEERQIQRTFDNVGVIVDDEIPLQFVYLIHLSSHLTNSEADMDRVAAAAGELLKKPCRNQHGESILHVACDAFPVCDERYPNRHCDLPSEEAVHVLLKADAGTNARDNAGNTPLHTAVFSHTRACDENDHFAAAITSKEQNIINLLLKFGAHFDVGK